METVIEILIKMGPLSTDGVILILVFCVSGPVNLPTDNSKVMHATGMPIADQKNYGKFYFLEFLVISVL